MKKEQEGSGKPPVKRGFAAMSPEQRKAIASAGGKRRMKKDWLTSLALKKQKKQAAKAAKQLVKTGNTCLSSGKKAARRVAKSRAKPL